MKAYLHIIFALFAAVAFPLNAFSDHDSYRVYVHYYDDDPELVHQESHWYDIEQSCVTGWLYPDGTFEEDYYDEYCGIYGIYKDYSDAWDFVDWRTGKYVISAEHGTDCPGFKISPIYNYDGVEYVCLIPDGYPDDHDDEDDYWEDDDEPYHHDDEYHEDDSNHEEPYWYMYYDLAEESYDHFADQGYYCFAAAYYFFYDCLAEYYIYQEAGYSDDAAYNYYVGIALYYYYLFCEYGDYASAEHYYDYFNDYAESFLVVYYEYHYEYESEHTYEYDYEYESGYDDWDDSDW